MSIHKIGSVNSQNTYCTLNGKDPREKFINEKEELPRTRKSRRYCTREAGEAVLGRGDSFVLQHACVRTYVQVKLEH